MEQPSQGKIDFFQDAITNQPTTSKNSILEFFEQSRQLPMQAIGQAGNIARPLHEASEKVGQMKESEMPFIPGSEYGGAYLPVPKLPTSEEIGEKIGYQEPTTPLGRYGKRIFGNIGSVAPLAAINPLAAPALIGGAALGGIIGQATKELGGTEPMAQAADILTSLPTAGKAIAKRATGKSGLTERFFEDAKRSHMISPESFENLQGKIEDESRKLADTMFSKNQTYEQIKNMPDKFYDEMEKGLDKVQQLSSGSPLKVSGDDIKTSLVNRFTKKKFPPITMGEQSKSYNNKFHEFYDEIKKSKDFGLDEVIDQYRDNNKEMRKFFKSGQSLAENEGKVDAMLDYNRALADEIHRVAPNSELDLLFKQTNKQFHDSKNISKIDSFIESVFPGKKVDYKKLQDYYKDETLRDAVSSTFGKGTKKEFDQLLKDLLKQERGMKFLKPTESAKFKFTHPSSWKNKFTGLFHGTPVQTLPKVEGGIQKLGAKLSPLAIGQVSKSVGERKEHGPSIDEVIASGKKKPIK